MRGALGGSGRALALLAALALAGCATMSDKECRAADWEAVGRADGVRGALPDELERHRKSCALHGIVPEEQRWREGYAKGLDEFCTPKGGYIAGRSGSGRKQACAGKPQETAFLAAFAHGQEVHTLLREIRELYRALHELDMAASAREQYTAYEYEQLRLRAADLAGALQRRQWETRRLDERYAIDYGAPLLSDAQIQG